jgi:hypothetical protein
MDWLLLALTGVLIASVGFTAGAWWGGAQVRRSARPVEFWGPGVWPPI